MRIFVFERGHCSRESMGGDESLLSESEALDGFWLMEQRIEGSEGSIQQHGTGVRDEIERSLR